MFRNLLISVFLSLGFNTAFAKNTETYECKKEGVANRKVEINHLAESKDVPCNVVYTNSTGPKRIFGAENENGFCEKQTKTFLQKLNSEGWNCEKVAVNTPTETAPPQAPAETPTAPAQEGTVQ